MHMAERGRGGLEKLTNEELRDALLQTGMDVGPVTDLTRRPYMSKLRQILPPSPSISNISGVANKVPPRKEEEPVAQEPPEPIDIRGCLWMQLNKPDHISSDTLIVFGDGRLFYVCRGIISAICKGLNPLLYNLEVPYPVHIITSARFKAIIWARGNETALHLKEKLSLQDHTVLLNQLRLFKNDQELHDEATLRVQGVVSDSVVKVIVEPLARVTSHYPYPVHCHMASLPSSFSIAHLRLGMGMDRLLGYAVKLEECRVMVPAQVQHILHVHDVPSIPFIIMLEFLYSGDLPLMKTTTTQPTNCGVILMMCIALGQAFSLPSFTHHSLHHLKKLLVPTPSPQQIQVLQKCSEALGISSLMGDLLKTVE